MRCAFVNSNGTVPSVSVAGPGTLAASPVARPETLRALAPDAGFKAHDSRLLCGRFPLPKAGLPPPLYANLAEFFAEAPERKWQERGTLLVLARHGTSVFNRLHDVFFDSHESPLTAVGRAMARSLGKLLAPFGVRSVYASPLGRSRESAALLDSEIRSARGVRVLENLKEISLGLLDAYPRVSLAEYEALIARLREPSELAAFATAHGLTEAELRFALDCAARHRRLACEFAALAGVSESEAVLSAREGLAGFRYRTPLGGTSFADMRDQAVKLRRELESVEGGPGAVVVTSHGMLNRALLLGFFGVAVSGREQMWAVKQDEGAVNVLWREEGAEEWQLLVLNG